MAEEIYSDNKNNKPRLNKKIVVIVIFFALLFAGMFAGLLFLNSKKEVVDPNVVAIVGTKKITKDDLNNKIFALSFEKNKQISDEQRKMLVEELIDERIIFDAADGMGITTTLEEKEAKARTILSNYNTLSDDKKAIVLKNMDFQLKKAKITEKVVSKKEGQYINVLFNRHFEGNVEGTDADRKKDREYAEKLSSELYGDIASGRISFEAAMDKINNDTVIDISTYKGVWPKPASSFVSGGYPTYHDPFMQEISGLRIGETTKPFILSSKSPSGQIGSEFSYTIAKVTKSGGGEYASYEDWLANEKQRLNIKRY